MALQHEYQVALSFASEDRPYVDEVANHLQNLGISVFYDTFEQVDLWGKNLYSHLDNVYRNKAHYCVMFISAAYRRKRWTNHERESAQSRAFDENREYILPARFDDTEIPGIHPTVGYIDLRTTQPKQLAEMIAQKINCSGNLDTNNSQPSVRPSKVPKKARSSTRILKPQGRRSAKVKKTKLATPLSKTKTVNLNKEGVSKLPNDQPVVYKILTEGGNNNFTGTAQRGRVQAKIREHLMGGKRYVPGSKVQVERFNNIDEAKAKASRIIARTKPKYNS